MLETQKRAESARRSDAPGSHSDSRRTRILLASVLALAAGCTGRRAELAAPDDLVWPAEDPRIRLESVIEFDQQPGRGAKFLRWLTEQSTTESFLRPYAVAWDDENLVVTDAGSGRAVRIDPRGRLQASEPGLFAQPVGVAACSRGIVVSDSRDGKIALLDRDLRLVDWLAEGLSRPTGVVCAGERIFLAETGAHRILVLDPQGERRVIGRRGDGPGQFNFPTSLVLDDGVLFVADTMNFRVQRIEATTGKFLDAFGELGDAPGTMPRLKGIALDSAGHLWAADGYLDQISLYDIGGALLISIGGPGNGPTEFSFPAGIAAHVDGRVAVVDSLNRRLKVFRVIESAAAGGT